MKNLDFLSRRPVIAVALLTFDTNSAMVDKRLPEGYVYENGMYQFPAGVWESYVVNGKEYNINGDRTVEEQRALIIEDLTRDGFSEVDARAFIDEVEMREGRPMHLNYETSAQWLRVHPELKERATAILKEAKTEVERILETNNRRRKR